MVQGNLELGLMLQLGGFRVQGSGFWGVFMVQGLINGLGGFRVQGSRGFRVQGFGVQGSGFSGV